MTILLGAIGGFLVMWAAAPKKEERVMAALGMILVAISSVFSVIEY